jgi:di/tricarboxylate transporter
LLENRAGRAHRLSVYRGVGQKTMGIGYSLAISELLLAPVTPSNTARGGGIVHPVMKCDCRQL